MSYQLMAWATRQKTGSAARKSVLLALANRANHDTGLCCPRMSLIAEETELALKTVQRAVVKLCEDGFISRKRKRRADGTWSVYHYVFPDLNQGTSASQPPVTESGSPPVTESGQEPGSSSSNQVAPGAKAPVATRNVRNDTDPPEITLIDGRNLGHDALAVEANISDDSPRHREVAVALNGQRGREGIRALLWAEANRRSESVSDVAIFTEPEAWEASVAEEIHYRSEMYRQRMPEGTILTPTALLKWWADLPSMKAQGDSYKGASVQDILNMTGAR